MRSTLTLAAAAMLAAVAGTAPALALCTICNASVRLDANLATCFAQRADDELAALDNSGKGFVIVDLSDCQSRGSLPTGNALDGPPLQLDTQFVLDGPGLKCLSQQIAAMDEAALDPSHSFALDKDCPAQ